MTAYNKLKATILAIMTSPCAYAITLEPIHIQSAPGELLYAEMNFSHADMNSSLRVGLAGPEDLVSIGISHQPPEDLNFFARRTGNGTGVIVITSSRPVNMPELNLVIKIDEGSSTRLQHIKTALKKGAPPPVMAQVTQNEKPLIPQLVVNEKEIGLNLPETAIHQPQVKTPVGVTTPPVQGSIANSKNMKETLAISTVIHGKDQPAPAVVAQVLTPPPVEKESNSTTPLAPQKVLDKKPVEQKPQTTAKDSKAKPDTTTQKPTTKKPVKAGEQQHVVRSNESLWSIASQLSAQSKHSIPELMQQIKDNNEHAFVGGDMNRLQQGVALNLDGIQQPRQSKPVTTKAQKPISGKAKYRINEAEMSLVAEHAQDSAQGISKKNTQVNQTSSELSSKVMTARQKTVKLQKNVTDLELGLRQKDQRIQVLNTRLAQLEQQLKQQEQAKAKKH